jgi:hypothetical protein
MRDMLSAEVIGVEKPMAANPHAGQEYDYGVNKKQGTNGVMPKGSFGFLRGVGNARL